MKTQFQRGSGCFTCRSCKKRTRDVADNGSCLLCPLCFERSSCENSLSDNGWGSHGDLDHCTTVEQVQSEFDRLMKAGQARQAAERKRTPLECVQLGGGPYPLCQCYVCFSARQRKAVQG